MVKTCKVKDRACISISMFPSKLCILGLSLNFSQGYCHNAHKKCLGEMFTLKFILMKTILPYAYLSTKSPLLRHIIYMNHEVFNKGCNGVVG